MSTLKKFLELNRKNKKNIAVVGDTLIDEYYFIDSNRISPEFPIPVFLSLTSTPDIVRPGGAGNVAYQFKHFNVNAILYGFADRYFENLAQEHGLNIQYMNIKGLACPIKRRFYYQDFPLCRWDVEAKNYNIDPIELRCGEQKYIYGKCREDIKILSDYNKGFFGEDVSYWLKGTTIVDPKKGPASKWKGCTIFKPNFKEAEELTGTTDVDEQLKILLSETDAKFVVITNAGDSVFVGTKPGGFTYVGTQEVKVISNIGAGDCFAAMLALAYSHGMSISECVEVAYEAGSVYVQKRYNEPITPYELLLHDDPVAAKLVDPEELVERDFTLCFTNGCFDILHEAHVDLLKYAKSTADKLVVALNTDESVSRLKGAGRPVNALESRMKMLSILEFVDFIVSFDEDTPSKLIELIQPDILCKGGDYTPEEIVGHNLVKDVRIFPYVEGKSTSELIKQIKNS